METIKVSSSKQNILSKAKTKQELSLNKTSEDIKRGSTLATPSTSNKDIVTKKKKIVKIDMQRLVVVNVESYKRYNLDNAFDDGGRKGNRDQQDDNNYHCKCVII
jgi:hypothetical protein